MHAVVQKPLRTLAQHALTGDHNYLPPIGRHTTRTRKMLLRASHCLLCLDQEQSAGSSVSMPEPDRIIRLKTVLSRTGLSRSTIYRKINEGTFPAQIRISVNGAGWHESDINRWIADPVSWRLKREFDGVR
jgi:prophage regulatory protein